MRLLLCLVLESLFSMPLLAQNLHFNASAGTDSEDIGIHFVVTDPANRRTGFLPTPGEIPKPLRVANLQEIPDASYLTNRLGSEDGDVDFEGIQFYSSPIIVGTYTVSLYGISESKYIIRFDIYKNRDELTPVEYGGFVSTGTIFQYAVYLDPTHVISAPVITKTVTFGVLRQDLTIAQKLNQIGDDKFVNSLTRMVNLAEKLADKCDKHKKDKKCQPAIAVLNMVIKRLETANRKCETGKPQLCNEDNDWNNFDKAHRSDHDYDDFFKDWDKDDWQKDKKKCKRFVTDEALKIITEDAQWLIKSLGGEIKKDHNDHHGGKE